MIRSAVMAALAISLFPCAGASAETWECHTSTNRVMDIAREGDHIWCATLGGALRWDRRDGSCTRFTTLDGLTDNMVFRMFIDSRGAKWFCTLDGITRLDSSGWTRYTLDNGLIYGEVRAMCEDGKGNLWLGTTNGVCRFDGSKWIVCTPENSLLSDYYTFAVIRDRSGAMWFGTASGLVRFDGTEWKAFTTADGLPDQEVSALLEDAEGNIWAGTRKGLARHDRDQWNSIPSEMVNALALGIDGAVWAAAGNSILCVRDTLVTEYTAKDGLPEHTSYLSLTVDSRGWIWAASDHNRAGAARFDGTSWKIITSRDGLPSDWVGDLLVDERGTAWFGTYGGGLARLDGKAITLCAAPNGPADSDVESMVFDGNGVLWASSHQTPGVLSRFDSDGWSTVVMDAAIEDRQMNMLACDRENRIWAGTDQGIASWDGAHWSRIALSPDNWSVRSLLTDSRNRIWCGRERGCLSLFEGVSWRDIYPDGGGVLEGFVQALMEDRDGNIWVGAYNGIGVFDGKTWGFHLLGRDIPSSSVQASILGLVQDGDGIVWAATGSGIMSFDGKSWKRREASETGTTATYIHCCERDPLGRIWFGTNDGGAVRLDHGEWKRYTTEDGLCSNSVQTIRFAPDGSIWFGTEGGISVLRENGPVTANRGESVPVPLNIRGNHPNPFNPSTTITFTLSSPSGARLTIHSITGQRVRTLLSGPLSAGTHAVVWDGRDDRGVPVSSGVYISRLESGNAVRSSRMLLLR